MKRDFKTYTILVIEDNSGDFVLIQDHLEETMVSPKIARAKTYKEAVTHLQELNDLIDVILLDLSLPDNQGENLIVDVLTLAPSVPIIALTGFTDIDFSIKSLSLGISDYLLKDELTSMTLYKSIIYNIERFRYKSDLQESERRYSELFHMSPQPMWVFDIDTYQFMDVNNAALKNYGYSNKEFLSMTLKDIRLAEDIPEMKEILAKSSKENDIFFQGIIRHKKKDGTVIQVKVQSNLIAYKGKKARVVLANDITDELNYIKTIEAQNKNFKEIAWLQSHVIRAPLTRIMGLIDLLQNYNDGDINVEEIMGMVVESANELDSIIRDITHKTDQVHI